MNIKKITAGILACCAIGGTLPFSAASVPMMQTIAAADHKEIKDEDGVITYYVYSDHVVLGKCSVDSAEVEIPAEFNGLPVTEIGDKAFENCTKLKTLAIPEGVEIIGQLPFAGTANFETISLPSTLKKISDGGFRESGIVSIEIPDSVEEYGSTIFARCNNLINVKLADNMPNIGNSAFAECASLKEIEIPGSIKALDARTFADCPSLEKVILNEGLEVINFYAFKNCHALKELTLPNTLKELRDSSLAFAGFTKLVIPDSVTFIDKEVFEYCPSLEEVVLPNTITEIPKNSFTGCVSLKKINIPDSVTKIGSVAFCDTAIEEVVLSKNVEDVNSAFFICPELRSITFYNPECKIYDNEEAISNRNEITNLYKRYEGIIYGYENSTAQAYAEKYNYKFALIGSAPQTAYGDVDGDGQVNAADASNVLVEYSILSTGGASQLTPEQTKAADVDGDGQVNAGDASVILMYYAYISTGGTETDLSTWYANK